MKQFRDKSGRSFVHANRRRDKPAKPISAVNSLVLIAMAIGAALAAASLAPSRPAFVWNFSASLPEGLYVFERRAWRIGDPVAFHPTGRADEILGAYDALPHNRLLLKRIAASAGDVVCSVDGAITINGEYAAKALQGILGGGAVPPDWAGCLQLTAGDVFLLGDHPASLDSRYFGPVSVSGIVGVISPLMTFSSQGASPQ